MGEARRRKQGNPTYGRIPKSYKDRERGIVLSSPVHISGNSGSFSSDIDPVLLRYSLLFWDRLVWPRNRLICLDGGPNEDYLESLGVLERPEISINFSGRVDLCDYFGKMHISFFNKMNRQEPNKWSLASGDGSFLWNNNIFSSDLNVLKFQLINSIPIPNNDMPFDEILNFKEKRKDELKCFQSEIDVLVSEVFMSENIDKEFSKKMKYIKDASENLIRVGKEYKYSMERVSNFCAAFEFSEVVKNIGSDIVNSLPFEIITNQIDFGGGALAYKIMQSTFMYMLTIHKQTSFEGLYKNNPFMYIYNINNHL